jgi:hypothetical protein
MCRNSKSAGIVMPVRSVPPGAWMRPRCPSGAATTICIARSTSRANPSDRCCVRRGMEAAQEFLRKALATSRSMPRKVNLDGNAASHRGLRLFGDEDPKWKSVVIRCCRYLNNIVEQDHRAIKRRCASMLGLKSFNTAAITFAGIELANRIRRGSFHSGAVANVVAGR